MARMYSVWNGPRRAYDYYEAQGDSAIHAGAPPRISSSAIGASPEQAAWRLPAGARRTGGGELPRGRIASLGGADDDSSLPSWLIFAAIGLLVWRMK